MKMSQKYFSVTILSPENRKIDQFTEGLHCFPLFCLITWRRFCQVSCPSLLNLLEHLELSNRFYILFAGSKGTKSVFLLSVFSKNVWKCVFIQLFETGILTWQNGTQLGRMAPREPRIPIFCQVRIPVSKSWIKTHFQTFFEKKRSRETLI